MQIKTPTSLRNPANRCGKTRFCVISAKVHTYPLRCLLLSCMYWWVVCKCVFAQTETKTCSGIRQLCKLVFFGSWPRNFIVLRQKADTPNVRRQQNKKRERSTGRGQGLCRWIQPPHTLVSHRWGLRGNNVVRALHLFPESLGNELFVLEKKVTSKVTFTHDKWNCE